MRKHLLVTISEDDSALYGLRFVGRFFRDPSQVEFTLFYTALSPISYSGMPSYAERQEMEAMIHGRQERGRQALDRARDILHGTYGYPLDNIHTKLRFRKMSTALDIIAEGERGLYDAIVLGRRGYSRLQELLRTSLSHELLDIRMDIPLWISRPEGQYRKNVLLCADGSTPGLRMADHVGFMLADERQHRVHVLHVWDPGSENRLEAEDIVEETVDVLVKNGLDHKRIDCDIIRSAGVARTILEKMEQGLYSVAAVGRTGERGSLFQRLFMGSVSLRLLHNLEGAALWVSH